MMNIYLVVVTLNAEWSCLLQRSNGSPCVFFAKQEAVAHIGKIAPHARNVRYRIIELAGKEIQFILPTTEY